MNYYLTMKELIEIIQNQLDGLKDKNVVKEGGLEKLVESVINGIKIEGYSLTRYGLSINHCRLEMYCSGLDKEIEFAEIRPIYKPDKRKRIGYGDILESITLKLTKEIPLDMTVLDASQFLDYEDAKENFERLEKEQKELLNEYKKNLDVMSKMQGVMQCQAYDLETKKESEKAKKFLESLYLK